MRPVHARDDEIPSATARPTERMQDAEYLLFERYREGDRSPLLRPYYRLRPFMPRQLQIALRRTYARRQARRVFPAWPIEPVLVERRYSELRRLIDASDANEVPLIGNWPEGHRFAFVLTHDVESPRGLANISKLREVERRHGFVSAWYFCAEQYPIPDGVFSDLRSDGCEIGLHGIDHHGRLFESRSTFDEALPAIHRYLREWEAVGFRSPALHRRADWMRELGCLYDTSFPDTDPYQPEPGGCCSILPFFIGDLVELPVTLAQDHTLFDILRHRDIALWLEKCEWIVRHEGLVNVIVHPDYMLTRERLDHYDRLLAWLGSQPGGWHALPREVATWWRTRAGLRLEPGSEGWHVVGPEADRATLAVARVQDDRLVIDRPQPACR